MLAASGTTNAQVVNCNAFMLGNYVEAGINWNGAFGSSTPPPSGYHPQSTASLFNSPSCGGSLATGSSLAFVADPDKDGWSAGTPASYGDYLLPGGPQEGWSITADASQYNSWNHDAASSDTIAGGLTGTILAYADSNGARHVTTQGILGGFLYITQFISLDTSKLYISVDVLIENSSLATINNIYYMRTVNPHNDQSLSSVAATKNKIEYNNYVSPDTLNRTVVSARGTVYNNAYISLATQDTRAVGFINKTSPLPNSTTIDNIFSGDPNYMYGLHDSLVSNTSIGLIFNCGSLSSGAGVYFHFVYAFSSKVIDSNLNTVNPHEGVGELSRAKQTVYPNPVTNTFSVAGLEPGDELSLFDMTGRKIEDAIAVNSSNNFRLNSVEPGTYILCIRDRNNLIKSRLPIQKR